MKFAIIVFPGSNCDHDAYKVIENIDGATPEFVWHKENDLSKIRFYYRSRWFFIW